MSYILVFLTLFLFPFGVCADYNPLLYSVNPVQSKLTSHSGIAQPAVMKDTNKYDMYFTSTDGLYDRIGLSYSANGIDWYEGHDLNVTNRQNAHDPEVLLEDNIYTLFFATSDGDSSEIWKNMASSPDGFDPHNATRVLASQGGWEGNSISSPGIFKDSGTYYLFYAGNGNGVWKMGLATSSDGVTWTRCGNNPIITSGVGASLIKKDGEYYLFYLSPNGTTLFTTASLNGCTTDWGVSRIVRNDLGNPTAVHNGNEIWLYGDYYGGIGLITETTPSVRYPIILLPGIFASWNSDAILHSSTVAQSDWILNPQVTEYEPIINTFKQLGYAENKDLFIVPYDWRQPITDDSSQLLSFVQNTIWNDSPYQPITIVGHSLGGVVARIFGEQNKTKPIKKIISVGSPLLGTAQGYKALAAGEIDRSNTLMWLAQKIVLELNRRNGESAKDTAVRTMPVLQDLVPTFLFLKKEDGTSVVSSFINYLLIQYPLDTTSSLFARIGGTGHNTLLGYTVSERSMIDTTLNNYPDGHPINSWHEDGDWFIPLRSTAAESPYQFTGTHNQTIYGEQFVKSILSLLNLPTEEISIPQGGDTPIFPALFIFVQSPATAVLQMPNGEKTNPDTSFHLSNIPLGTYTVTLTGTGIGEYTFHTWLIGETNDVWQRFTGTIHEGEKKVYKIQFDPLTGGNTVEYVEPKPTATPTITPTPTKNPRPTTRPTPTKRPTPTPVKHHYQTKKNMLWKLVVAIWLRFQNKR